MDIIWYLPSPIVKWKLSGTSIMDTHTCTSKLNNFKTLSKSINGFRKTPETSVKVILKMEMEIAKKPRNKSEIAQHPHPLVNYYRACMYNI